MSLVNLSHVCSHLQNASLARLGLTSIPYTRLHLSLCLLLQKQGFFSSVKLAGPTPPLSSFPPNAELALPQLSKHRQPPIARRRTKPEDQTRETALVRMLTEGATPEALKEEGWVDEDVTWASLHAARSPHSLEEEGIPISAMGLEIQSQPLSLPPSDPSDLEFTVTQSNRASRRLWLGLKYWEGLPVLRKASMMSKPTKRIWLNSREIGEVVRGRRAGEVKGMTQVGEVVAVSTDRGVMEARECAERKVGGMVLCRVW
nr:hypothetical protein B0A51_18101 [Rachicladosporium sp. CCFEE 5018]